MVFGEGQPQVSGGMSLLIHAVGGQQMTTVLVGESVVLVAYRNQRVLISARDAWG